MTTTTSVREAGYRERVFLKALLVSNGRAEEWPAALDLWRYDPSHDVVFVLHPLEQNKVAWEGGRSREILAEHEHDDSGCDHGALTPEEQRRYVAALVGVYMQAPACTPEEEHLSAALDAALLRLGMVEADVISRYMSGSEQE